MNFDAECLVDKLNHTNSCIKRLRMKKMVVIGERFSTKKMSDSDRDTAELYWAVKSYDFVTKEGI